jgi:hypothetical protein
MKPIVVVVKGMLDEQAERYTQVVTGVPEEALNWRPGDETTNSVAQIVRHATAAQDWLLGVALGDAPAWDQDDSLRNDPATKEELLGLIVAAQARKEEHLARIDLLDMSETIDSEDGPGLRGYFVVHSAEHGAEHLGHAELTQQLWEQRA